MTARIDRSKRFVKLGFLLGAFFASDVQGAQLKGEAPRAGPGSPLAVVGVTVIPMDAERTIPGLTVVVEEGRIAAIGPEGEIAVPEDAIRIDGSGRFLTPGLADMSVRLEHRNDLLLFLANGVTAIRSLGDPEVALALRGELEAGQLPGPLVFTSGATIDRDPVSDWDHVAVQDPEGARRAVLEQMEAGVDVVAVTPVLSAELYVAVARAAREVGLPLGGEAPIAGGLELAVREGQASIDNLVNVLFVHFGSDLDRGRLGSAAELLGRGGISVTTAISSFDKAVAMMGNPSELRRLIDRPEVRFASPEARRRWGQGNIFVSHAPSPYLARVRRFLPSLANELNRAGVRLVLGTDAGTAGNVPGFAVHDELRSLVRAGLSPYEALRLATVHAAELMGAGEQFGTVAVGRRADLLLLEEDPLADVRNLALRAGVVVGGRWFPEAQLRADLEVLAAGYPEPHESMAYPFLVKKPEPLASGGLTSGASR